MPEKSVTPRQAAAIHHANEVADQILTDEAAKALIIANFKTHTYKEIALLLRETSPELESKTVDVVRRAVTVAIQRIVSSEERSKAKKEKWRTALKSNSHTLTEEDRRKAHEKRKADGTHARLRFSDAAQRASHEAQGMRHWTDEQSGVFLRLLGQKDFRNPNDLFNHVRLTEALNQLFPSEKPFTRGDSYRKLKHLKELLIKKKLS